MTQSLIDLAQRIEAQPWNRPGTDKTWVLQAMSTMLRFREEVRQARLVGTP
jgi:hypothetical protein